MKKYFEAFALALSMLSTLPLFKLHNFFQGINALSAMFYPLVGFILGLILFAIHTLLSPYLPAPHLTTLIFVLWIILTGALHLDGLSDTIDGFFVPKSRALEVMKDSHIGGMGMIFTLAFLLLKLSSLLYLDALYLLPIILMFSRLNAIFAIYFYKYISSGVGAFIKEELGLKELAIALLYSLILAYFFSFSALYILLNFALLALLSHLFTRRLGGLNGDMYGFIIEFSELFLLNLLLISL